MKIRSNAKVRTKLSAATRYSNLFAFHAEVSRISSASSTVSGSCSSDALCTAATSASRFAERALLKQNPNDWLGEINQHDSRRKNDRRDEYPVCPQTGAWPPDPAERSPPPKCAEALRCRPPSARSRSAPPAAAFRSSTPQRCRSKPRRHALIHQSADPVITSVIATNGAYCQATWRTDAVIAGQWGTTGIRAASRPRSSRSPPAFLRSPFRHARTPDAVFSSATASAQ